jgi:hypothetical protein
MNVAFCDPEAAVQVTVPVGWGRGGVYQLNPILQGPSAGKVVGLIVWELPLTSRPGRITVTVPFE